jgi:hypothetical protein
MTDKKGKSTPSDLGAEVKLWDEKKINPRTWVDAPESVPGFSQTKPISLRMQVNALKVIKEFARRKGVGYQVLLKMWIDEKIAEERNLFVSQRRIEKGELADNVRELRFPQKDRDIDDGPRLSFEEG